MTRGWLSYLTTTLFLLLTGVVAGVVMAVLGLALASALESLRQSGGEGLLGFLSNLFFLSLGSVMFCSDFMYCSCNNNKPTTNI